MMTITKLEHFHAVCKFQSVTKAAKYLHISQPSVTASIRDLEAEFHVNLFRHEGKRLILTTEGEFLLEHAGQLLKEYTQLSRQMQDLGKNKNLFRLGVPPMAGTIFLPGLYKAFHNKYPEIQLSITECGSIQAMKLLEKGKLDLAMASLSTLPDVRLQTLRLGRSKVMLCVSPEHRLIHEKAIKFSMLKDEPLVLFQEDSAPEIAIERIFEREGIVPNVLLYSSQLSMIKQFILDGTAAAFLFEDLVKEDKDIISIPFEQEINFDVVLMWKKNQYLYSDVSCFLEFAKNYIK